MGMRVSHHRLDQPMPESASDQLRVRPQVNITLPKYMKRFIQERIRSGHARTMGEVVELAMAHYMREVLKLDQKQIVPPEAHGE